MALPRDYDTKIWRFMDPSRKLKLKQKILDWLGKYYVPSAHTCLPRQLVYEHFTTFCLEASIPFAERGAFGKIIAEKFSEMRMRRLGKRGENQYYYHGVDLQPHFLILGKIAAGRIVTPANEADEFTVSMVTDDVPSQHEQPDSSDCDSCSELADQDGSMYDSDEGSEPSTPSHSPRPMDFHNHREAIRNSVVVTDAIHKTHPQHTDLNSQCEDFYSECPTTVEKSTDANRDSSDLDNCDILSHCDITNELGIDDDFVQKHVPHNLSFDMSWLLQKHSSHNVSFEMSLMGSSSPYDHEGKTITEAPRPFVDKQKHIFGLASTFGVSPHPELPAEYKSRDCTMDLALDAIDDVNVNHLPLQSPDLMLVEQFLNHPSKTVYSETLDPDPDMDATNPGDGDSGYPGDPSSEGDPEECKDDGRCPCDPDDPDQGGPCDPDSPCDPGNQGEPGDPGNPCDPGNQGEPGDPGNPCDLGNQGEPGDPGNPCDPGIQSEPGDPGNPCDPCNPSEPGDPDHSCDPDYQGVPGDPGNSCHPVNHSEPGDLGNPCDLGNQGEPGDHCDLGNPCDLGNQGEPGDPGSRCVLTYLGKPDQADSMAVSNPQVLPDIPENNIPIHVDPCALDEAALKGEDPCVESQCSPRECEQNCENSCPAGETNVASPNEPFVMMECKDCVELEDQPTADFGQCPDTGSHLPTVGLRRENQDVENFSSDCCGSSPGNNSSNNSPAALELPGDSCHGSMSCDGAMEAGEEGFCVPEGEGSVPNEELKSDSEVPTESDMQVETTDDLDADWPILTADQKKAHKEKAAEWLGNSFEISPQVCLPRTALYEQYCRHCRWARMRPSPQAIFGRILQHRFPWLQMRRLGGRTNLKYYYLGIDIRHPKSAIFKALHKGRLVTPEGKPKSNRVFNGAKKKR